MDWLRLAQDAGDDDGVARSYTLRHHRNYNVRGWLPSYPETTGYIIPTFYDFAAMLDSPGDAARAERMARWEAEIQMESGAVRGGTIADAPSPSDFNTGQVIFGWVRAAEETGDSLFDECAARASKWLIEYQDEDGCWRRSASKFARPGGHVYNTRTAWALALYGTRAGDERALLAARRSAEFALSRQSGNGWLAENCLDDEDRPLVHTIAYAARGMLETGLILGEDRFVEGARKIAVELQKAQRTDGSLSGRYDKDWNGAVRWSCLTGNSQMALCWDRLAEIDGNPSFRETADRVLRFVMSTQVLHTKDPGVRGGVAGPYPIWGDYGYYEYLNWAAKFTADALLGRVAGKLTGTSG
jgi:hypothetical protein